MFSLNKQIICLNQLVHNNLYLLFDEIFHN